MKRLFAILLALMLVIGMVGCGQDTTTPTETIAPTVETTAPTEPVSTDIPVVVTEQYAVYIVDVVYEPTYGATISFRLENLSPYNVTFHFSNYAINGVWEVEALTSIFDTEDVSIGHKQVIDRTFSATDLKQIGVDVIEVLEFNLDVYHTKADGTQDYLTGDVTDPYAITLVASAE